LTTIVFTGISLAAVNKNLHAPQQQITNVATHNEEMINSFTEGMETTPDENFIPLPTPVKRIIPGTKLQVV